MTKFNKGRAERMKLKSDTELARIYNSGSLSAAAAGYAYEERNRKLPPAEKK